MSTNPQVRIQIADDGEQATLIVAPGVHAQLIAPQALLLLLRGAGVQIDQEVEKKLAELAAGYAPRSDELRAVVARSVPPVCGEDGRIEWRGGFDPAATTADLPASDAGTTNHYAGHAYIRVMAGDVVGVVHKPTEGVDGRDVRGRPIKARPGRSAPIRLHPTLTLDSNDNVVAINEGTLELRENELFVTQRLDVTANVDFSTGNIDFAGSVNVPGRVVSGFKVAAGVDLRVGGLIECAEIRCAGDFDSRGGMAGGGTLSVGRHARMVYVEKVSGEIRGDLAVEREIIDCNLAIGGDLRCPNATVLGGRVAVTGSMLVKTIGSEAYAATTIVLGDVPLLVASRRETVKRINQIKLKITQLAEQERLIRINPRPSAQDRETLTETAYEISQQNRALAEWTTKLDAIDDAVRAQRRLDVHILKVIYPHVTFRIDDFTVVFKDVVKGPIWICWDEQKKLMWRTESSAPRPLKEIAQVVRDTSAASPIPAVAA